MRENTTQRLHRALERQFADEQNALERIARHRPHRPEDGRGNGQIESAPRFLQVRGREIDDDPALVDMNAHLRQGVLDANAALTDGRLGEPHQLEERRAAHRLHFDANGVSLETNEGCAEGRGEHGRDSLQRASCRHRIARFAPQTHPGDVSRTDRRCPRSRRRWRAPLSSFARVVARVHCASLISRRSVSHRSRVVGLAHPIRT